MSVFAAALEQLEKGKASIVSLPSKYVETGAIMHHKKASMSKKSDSLIDDTGAEKIASALVGNKITVFLDLSGLFFIVPGDVHQQALSSPLSLLNVGNGISDVGATSIAKVLENNYTLTELSLSGIIT